MPILDSNEKITPRSVVRHRPIIEGTAPYAKASASIRNTGEPVTNVPPLTQRASRPRTADVLEQEDEWELRRDIYTTNDTRISSTGPIRRAVVPVGSLPKTPRPSMTYTKEKTWWQAHPLFYLGIGMMCMLLAWMALSAALGWFNTVLDDIHYGRPRTYQVDARVGHNEQTGIASHFIAINLNRHVEIIEIPGGDAAHTRIFVGPQLYGSNDDLVPVTLKFVDVNGDHKPDMLVDFQGTQLVYINDQGSFRPMTAAEHDQVEQFLQQHHP